MLGMLGDKKKLISIILAEKAPKPEEKSVDGLEADFSSGYEGAAKDVLMALESKDAKALASAMKDFIMLCVREEDYSEEDKDDY